MTSRSTLMRQAIGQLWRTLTVRIDGLFPRKAVSNTLSVPKVPETKPMKTSILQKALDELSKEEPRIDYVRGMLETLIAMDEKPLVFTGKEVKVQNTAIPGEVKPKEEQDQGEILTAQAKARLSTVRELAEKSTEIS